MPVCSQKPGRISPTARRSSQQPRRQWDDRLFHVTADTTWSNLPISGLFVDMLRKIVALSNDAGKAADQAEGQAKDNQKVATVPPLRASLDGFGDLGQPPATAKPVPVEFLRASATANIRRDFTVRPISFWRVNALHRDDTSEAAELFGARLCRTAFAAGGADRSAAAAVGNRLFAFLRSMRSPRFGSAAACAVASARPPRRCLVFGVLSPCAVAVAGRTRNRRSPRRRAICNRRSTHGSPMSSRVIPTSMTKARTA